MNESQGRLDKVAPRQTFIIKLFVYNNDPFEGRPTAIIGPFTRTECERIEPTLTCRFKREQITTTVPEWAVSE